MTDLDKFIDKLEEKFGTKLDRERCKQVYLNACLDQLQFFIEQQGKDISNEELMEIKTMLKAKLGIR